MISTWIVFCIVILIRCFRKKDYQSLKKYVINFLLGMMLIILPIVLWLSMNGALRAFWNDYIVFNRAYCSTEGTSFFFEKPLR